MCRQIGVLILSRIALAMVRLAHWIDTKAHTVLNAAERLDPQP